MFWIVGGDAAVEALHKMTDAGPVSFLATELQHKAWQGFAFEDLIFPMFVFIVGVSLVFSLSKLVEREGRTGAARRVITRGFFLYLLGIFYYGGLSTPLAEIRLLGVLQRIALCYLFAGLAFCFLGLRGRIIACVSLLLGYWALMTFVSVPGVGAGHFEEGKNLANWVDSQYLPWRKWDGDHDPEGLLSTLPAIAGCLIGVFAGMFLKSDRESPIRKVVWIAGAGVALATVGWLWNYQFPVVKKLWTSSFVLVASGYSCLFLATFYWIIEVRGWRAWAQPFVWIGMNPITIYLIHHFVDFDRLAGRFVGGDVAKALGHGAEFAMALTVIALVFWICRFLHQRKIFLRV